MDMAAILENGLQAGNSSHGSAGQLRARFWAGKAPHQSHQAGLLQFVAGCPGADVVTVTQRFGLSDIGARCKLWRLTKQRLLETIPHTYGRTKAWQLTRAGRRHLRYLKEAEDYGGTKGLSFQPFRFLHAYGSEHNAYNCV